MTIVDYSKRAEAEAMFLSKCPCFAGPCLYDNHW